MKTNFFKNIAELNIPGNWKFTIHADDKGLLTVSALFNAIKNEDNASKLVPPMLLRGTADELDEGFFDTIEKPVQEAAGLFNNMETYMKGLEEAKKQSKMEQDKKTQESKAKALAKANEPKDGIEVSTEPKVSKEEKRKIYDEAMKKIGELNDTCKYEEALSLLPSTEDYPGYSAEIDQ
ncbi:PRTRC system protein E [Mucilaginibacter sp. L196]|uniref:PRTRC system protein E n=1 Tax=Mucilaginibacter sp. L196 TaxID=1641870 RepID=UPI00131C08A8|nr:PRTRC system protein E [Mucilaginibacter sp. L196]